jgi:hypothetical protein
MLFALAACEENAGSEGQGSPAQYAAFKAGKAAFERDDYAYAVLEWRRLAEEGHALAQGSLGVMYNEGLSVAQNYDKAVAWFGKAAEQGHAEAQNNLGLMYEKGHGVTQDFVQAQMWFNLAAAKGDEDATKNRDIVAGKMTPAQIAEAQRLAGEWTEKHPQ